MSGLDPSREFVGPISRFLAPKGHVEAERVMGHGWTRFQVSVAQNEIFRAFIGVWPRCNCRLGSVGRLLRARPHLPGEVRGLGPAGRISVRAC